MPLVFAEQFKHKAQRNKRVSIIVLNAWPMERYACIEYSDG
jgi:hypothetical protein